MGVIFFVPALRSSLLLYSKGFALLTFKNGVEIAAVEGGAASIDGHAVPEWSCHDPGTGGVVLGSRRDARDSKNRFLMKITVYFARNPCSWPAKCDLEEQFPSEYSAPNLIGARIFSRHKNFLNGSNRPGASVVCNLTCQIAVKTP